MSATLKTEGAGQLPMWAGFDKPANNFKNSYQ